MDEPYNEVKREKAAWLLEQAIPNGECLECHLSAVDKGFSQIKIKDKHYKASRLIYEQQVGPIGDLFVLHKCDNPRCINPNHLFLGTQADNVRDMINKGRKGDNHSSLRVISKDKKRELFSLYCYTWMTKTELAIKYLLSRRSVSRVIDQMRMELSYD